MALIALLLGLKGKSLHKFEGGFEGKGLRIYDQPRSTGMRCANKNCIVHDPMEAQYVRNKFHIVKPAAANECKLRCVYCETDIEQFVVASRKNKWYSADTSTLLRSDDHHLKELVVFADEADAAKGGFHCRRTLEGRAPRRAAVR
jgi:hypothetical protein